MVSIEYRSGLTLFLSMKLILEASIWLSNSIAEEGECCAALLGGSRGPWAADSSMPKRMHSPATAKLVLQRCSRQLLAIAGLVVQLLKFIECLAKLFFVARL